jgi:hypothetical protein
MRFKQLWRNSGSFCFHHTLTGSVYRYLWTLHYSDFRVQLAVCCIYLSLLKSIQNYQKLLANVEYMYDLVYKHLSPKVHHTTGRDRHTPSSLLDGLPSFPSHLIFHCLPRCVSSKLYVTLAIHKPHFRLLYGILRLSRCRSLSLVLLLLKTEPGRTTQLGASWKKSILLWW